ncbi:MAG: type VI secretion system tip protein TssI/VgrG [Planctomycetota bacterium]
MASVQQETRLLAVKSPLGKDVLLLTGFSGKEEMSRLFHFNLEMFSEQDAIEAKDIVGKNVTVTIKRDDDFRFFNGFVRRFRAGSMASGFRQYSAEVVPWLWFLTRTADCRIFQKKKVPDIINAIFSDLGFTDFEFRLKGSYRQREYCVQYRETDFNFVSRLMEEEGIFYFFKHEDGKHTLVVADHKGAYEWCPDREIEFEHAYTPQTTTGRITRWEHEYEFHVGKWAHTDYNFETPSTNLMSNSNTITGLPGVDKFEIYDFPGTYEKKDEGTSLIKVRMEAEEVPYNVAMGNSHAKSMFPGGKFKLTNHYVPAENDKTYVLTSVSHHANEPADFTARGARPTTYENQFTCIPEEVTYRPARITPKPTVQGSQTAVVVGPAGEEIYTDSYGRVKVQFFWDREGKKDEKSSCWIRVSQNWAGKNWGIVFNPRIGQEVIVDFLEGDPDRPIIIGRVYNAEQMPPYELPAQPTKSTIKTRSSKGGTPANFNEIRFEDKKGSEQLFIHAEKNQDIEVENDETHWVGHDRKKTIDHDETTRVKHDRTETVDNNETITIGVNRTETVGANESITVASNRTRFVGKNEAVTVGLSRTHTVGVNEAITIGAAQEVTIGGLQSVIVGASQAITVGAGQNVTIGGDHQTDVSKGQKTTVAKDCGLKAGKNIMIEAGDSLTLKCGSANIVLKKNGDILINGKKIQIKGSGDVTIKGSKIKEN